MTRKMIKTFHGLFALMVLGVASLFLYSCANDNAPNQPELPTSEETGIGETHNDVLADILVKLQKVFSYVLVVRYKVKFKLIKYL